MRKGLIIKRSEHTVFPPISAKALIYFTIFTKRIGTYWKEGHLIKVGTYLELKSSPVGHGPIYTVYRQSYQ